MSEELNKLLKKAYYTYKDHEDPPVPLKTIKKYLELEGVELNENNSFYLKNCNGGECNG